MAPPIVAPEAITADWLTRVLAAGGVRARVRDFAVRRIGTGQIGQSIRFDLAYDEAPPGAPTSLVGKFPAPEPDSRNTGVVLLTVCHCHTPISVRRDRGGSSDRCVFAPDMTSP